MPHGRHIYAKASDMVKATICTYPQSDHALPHWKCVLQCCAECPYVNIPDQETDKNMRKQHPQLGFKFMKSLDVVLPMVELHRKKENMYMCKQETLSDKSTKVHTRKELVMMERTISDFHTRFYIPAMHKLAFHLPHVQILGTNNCGEMQRTAFKQRELFQDVLRFRDYAERLVASFANQI